ncbi:MAG: hypothetical protein CM1200mP16_08480 [Nitrospina sp.]|nr:MAG: hypothetical protein CM1200mP16_08480 [Nitrospina sp.]
MESPKILDYWISFFRDLLLGTFKKLFIFCFAGLGLGFLSIQTFDSQVLDLQNGIVGLKHPFLLSFLFGIWVSGFYIV